MTEQTETPEVSERDIAPDLPITFRGRAIQVRMPSPEQLLVWRRTLRQLQSAEESGWNAEQVMSAMERTRKIIDSVMVNTMDVDWLDDEMLVGTVDLTGTAEIIHMTVEAFAKEAEREKAQNGTRSERRAAKKTPAKKAARKAPNKKVVK